MLLHGSVCYQTPITREWSDEEQQHLYKGGNEVSVGNKRVFGMIGFFTDARQLETVISKVSAIQPELFQFVS